MRAESERIFLDFFKVPDDAPERLRPGVYAVHNHGPPGRRTQIILLDTRSFRGPLKRAEPTASCPKAHYVANPDVATTLLGAAQWSWLEQQLRQPADLRVIVSSIQVIPDQQCFEKWGNLPHERQRLFELIGATAATGIVLVSGDRHLAEISRLDHPAIGYPLYEVTASGMNSAGAGQGEVNRFRTTKDNFRRDNFGLIEVDWSQPDPALRLQVLDTDGALRMEQSLRLSQLRPAR